jgi:hypothetical protein
MQSSPTSIKEEICLVMVRMEEEKRWQDVEVQQEREHWEAEEKEKQEQQEVEEKREKY